MDDLERKTIIDKKYTIEGEHRTFRNMMYSAIALAALICVGSGVVVHKQRSSTFDKMVKQAQVSSLSLEYTKYVDEARNDVKYVKISEIGSKVIDQYFQLEQTKVVKKEDGEPNIKTPLELVPSYLITGKRGYNQEFIKTMIVDVHGRYPIIREGKSFKKFIALSQKPDDLNDLKEVKGKYQK